MLGDDATCQHCKMFRNNRVGHECFIVFGIVTDVVAFTMAVIVI